MEVNKLKQMFETTQQHPDEGGGGERAGDTHQSAPAPTPPRDNKALQNQVNIKKPVVGRKPVVTPSLQKSLASGPKPIIAAKGGARSAPAAHTKKQQQTPQADTAVSTQGLTALAAVIQKSPRNQRRAETAGSSPSPPPPPAPISHATLSPAAGVVGSEAEEEKGERKEAMSTRAAMRNPTSAKKVNNTKNTNIKESSCSSPAPVEEVAEESVSGAGGTSVKARMKEWPPVISPSPAEKKGLIKEWPPVGTGAAAKEKPPLKAKEWPPSEGSSGTKKWTPAGLASKSPSKLATSPIPIKPSVVGVVKSSEGMAKSLRAMSASKKSEPPSPARTESNKFKASVTRETTSDIKTSSNGGNGSEAQDRDKNKGVNNTSLGVRDRMKNYLHEVSSKSQSENSQSKSSSCESTPERQQQQQPRTPSHGSQVGGGEAALLSGRSSSPPPLPLPPVVAPWKKRNNTASLSLPPSSPPPSSSSSSSSSTAGSSSSNTTSPRKLPPPPLPLAAAQSSPTQLDGSKSQDTPPPTPPHPPLPRNHHNRPSLPEEEAQRSKSETFPRTTTITTKTNDEQQSHLSGSPKPHPKQQREREGGSLKRLTATDSFHDIEPERTASPGLSEAVFAIVFSDNKQSKLVGEKKDKEPRKSSPDNSATSDAAPATHVQEIHTPSQEAPPTSSPSSPFPSPLLSLLSPTCRSSGGGGGGEEGGEQHAKRNVDSGFISEAPEDLLTRDLSMDVEEQKPSADTCTSAAKEEDPEVWDEAKIEKAKKKRKNITQELLETEKTYVDRLKMIAVNFYQAVEDFNSRNKRPLSEQVVMQIFLNIGSIHTLNQTMLEGLQQSLDNWDTREQIGDVMCRFAPFLKLYATYIGGFEDAMKTLTEWSSKEKKFGAFLKEFEREYIGTGLGVAHFMLEPVQRIPRYKLLLTDYLKNVPKDSLDRPDTEKALNIITVAADHNNAKIKQLEISNEILTIQRSILDYEGTLLAPSRIFLKKGELNKTSRKTLTSRTFFLFSDVLIHTEPVSASSYKFKDEMPIFGMKVEEQKVSLTAHTFTITSTTRSLILVASSEEEKLEWMQAVQAAIDSDDKKRKSLRRASFLQKKVELMHFGTKAPIMIPDKSVTMCQLCTSPFTFTFRRHHCRACGMVVCGNCSDNKVHLPYLQKKDRVCDTCYLSSKPEKKSPVAKRLPQHEGVLDLKGYEDDTVYASYVSCQEGRKFTKLWLQVKADMVLYKSKAHGDIKAITSLPLPGYQVNPIEKTLTIELKHPSGKKDLLEIFKVDSQTEFDNWVSVLNRATRLELSALSSSPLSPIKERASSDIDVSLLSRSRTTSESPLRTASTSSPSSPVKLSDDIDNDIVIASSCPNSPSGFENSI